MRGDRRSRYHFPWREGNRFELLEDGDEFFPRMLDAISSAQSFVLLEIYLIESGAVADRFIGSLISAAEKGIQIYISFDDFGSIGLNDADRKRLVRKNIHTAFYNPVRYREFFQNFHRDHRKLLIIDGAVAYVGGTGIADQFDPPKHAERKWRETMVEVTGPIVRDWQTLFKDAWCHLSSVEIEEKTTIDQSPLEEGALGRVVISGEASAHEISRSLIKRIRNAESRIWFATAYFIPSWKLRRALIKAAKRGIEVRLLLPGKFTDHPGIRHAGRRFYSRLLRHGIKIFEFQPRFLHSKTVICDDWVSIGSSNMDRWGLRWNLEANQEINDEDFSQQVQEMFLKDFLESDEFTYESWRHRPWHRRLMEWYWGRVDQLLERLNSRHWKHYAKF
ncbi:MAG: phosphatidylserine/phosphatidylglycerophosphate/cardiolipin synthase family protein [Gammaproteobacteria bacterium]